MCLFVFVLLPGTFSPCLQLLPSPCAVSPLLPASASPADLPHAAPAPIGKLLVSYTKSESDTWQADKQMIYLHPARTGALH